MNRMAKGVVVTGVKEIDRRLRRLEPRVGKKVIRQAIRKALRPVLAAAKANAPVESGALRRSIKIRAVKSKLRRKGVVGLDVRVDRKTFRRESSKAAKSSAGDKPAGGGPESDGDWYAAVVEFGDSTHAGHPFMGPAYASAGPATREIAMKLIRDGVEHQARLLGKG